MTLDADRVSTVTFDSYSTLVDVDAAERALAERVDDPEPVSKLCTPVRERTNTTEEYVRMKLSSTIQNTILSQQIG